MATGAPGTNGVWQYGEDDSETTFSALLNKAASTTDTQLGLDRTRLDALEARSLSGLVLVSSTTVGTAVSAVTVSGAFSTTYDDYLVTYTDGVGSTSAYLNLVLGGTATGYYGGLVGQNFNNTASLASDNNATRFTYIGSAQSDGADLFLTVRSPFLTKKTVVSSNLITGTAGYTYNGALFNTTSYTAFTIGTSAGTLTGGTIRVYGMKK